MKVINYIQSVMSSDFFFLNFYLVFSLTLTSLWILVPSDIWLFSIPPAPSQRPPYNRSLPICSFPCALGSPLHPPRCPFTECCQLSLCLLSCPSAGPEAPCLRLILSDRHTNGLTNTCVFSGHHLLPSKTAEFSPCNFNQFLFVT